MLTYYNVSSNISVQSNTALFLKVFPNDLTTHLNASTLELAKRCFDDLLDMNTGSYLEEKLCRSAVKYGHLPALIYLRSVDCEWAFQYSQMGSCKWLILG